MIKHHVYDGLGRLVKTQSPFPEPGSIEYPGLVRSERFYYDGIRRIQELVTDPVLNQGAAGQSGDPELENLAGQGEQGGDPEGAPVPLEEGQLEGDPEAPGGGAQGWTPNAVLAREYIWGPGDSYAGVDELLVQFGEDRKPYWAIQDGGGDVVAVVKAPGSSPSSTQPAKVCGQWTYDAYGAVQSFDLLATHPVVHCGHKGLFFDRLDVGAVEVGGGGAVSEIPRLVPYAHALYHVRNRVYSPQHGRFMQLDPNATAMMLVAMAAMHGQGLEGAVATLDLSNFYNDGANLYAYLGSNPWGRFDALGLSYDPFSMVDEYLAESAGSTAAFMERVIGGAKAAAYVGAVILSNMPFPITAIAADLGADALEGQVSPELRAMRKYLGYAMIGAMVGKIAYTGIKTAVAYLSKAGIRGLARDAWNGIKAGWRWYRSLEDRAGEWLLRKIKGGCGCFVAGTLVWTSTGLIPIDAIQSGDEVLAFNEASNDFEFREVTNTIKVAGAALLDLTVVFPDGRTETIRTTDEHPFFVECEGWRRADCLSPGRQIKTLTGVGIVAATRMTSERQMVHNLTVEGLETFYVGEDGVVVHNCKFDAVRDYWQKVYGMIQAPQRSVLLRDPKTGREFSRMVTKDVHHIESQASGGGHALDNLVEAWPWEHAAIDAWNL